MEKDNSKSWESRRGETSSTFMTRAETRNEAGMKRMQQIAQDPQYAEQAQKIIAALKDPTFGRR